MAAERSDDAANDLPITVSLQEDEEAQLAHFDRFLEEDLEVPSSVPAQSNVSSRQESHPVAPIIDSASLSLDAIAKKYPSYDRGALQAVLAACDGNVDTAYIMLRDASFQSTASRVPETNRSANNALSNDPPNSSALNHDVDVSSDATLAALLQRQEASAARRHRRNNAIIPLSSEAMARLVSSLREIVVPALKAHFAELILPDTRETAGSFEYELRSLQVAALSLPSDNVSVQPAADSCSVLVSVVDANLELEVGHWSYEGRGLVAIRDNGRARASVHGLNIAIRLVPRWDFSGGTRVRIEQCDVTVNGVVRFKTQGAAADWAYNTIAVLFKPLVVSYVKEAVADSVEQALSVHLRQLEIASRLDQQIASNGNNIPLNHTASTHDPQPPVSAGE